MHLALTPQPHSNCVDQDGERLHSTSRLWGLASVGAGQLLRDCSQAYWNYRVSSIHTHCWCPDFDKFLSPCLLSRSRLCWHSANVLIVYRKTPLLRSRSTESKSLTTMREKSTRLYAPSNRWTSAAASTRWASSYYAAYLYTRRPASLNGEAYS
jgi:hypothetical protein